MENNSQITARQVVSFMEHETGVPFGDMIGMADRDRILAMAKNEPDHIDEAGNSAKQIAAVLGHSTLSEVERYTRDADQVRLADEAIDRMV